MDTTYRPAVFASLIQSSFGDPHGNFEAVVKLANNELWHYWRDNDNDSQVWAAGARICTGAAYAGSLIQSHFTGSADGVAGNFEVVVPLMLARGQVQLTHFWRDNTKPPFAVAAGSGDHGGHGSVVRPGCSHSELVRV